LPAAAVGQTCFCGTLGINGRIFHLKRLEPAAFPSFDIKHHVSNIIPYSPCLSVATMHRENSIKLLTLDTKTLRAGLKLKNGRRVFPPRQSLGNFSMLPTELLHQILGDIDIPTLTAFQRVSRLARAVVDNIPEYSALLRSHRDILRAVLASQANSYTCRDLHTELKTSNPKCQTCDDEATHLYLITCRLVCRRCFTGDWRAAIPPPSLTPQTRALYASEYPYGLLQDPNEWNHRGYPTRHPFQDYAPLQEAHILEHCREITTEELSRIPHTMSLPARYQCGNKKVSTGPRVKLYDTMTLLANHKLSDCYCMRSYPEVMRRYQAVIALQETEREAEGDVPMGTVRDPFEPSYRAVWMN